MLRRALPWMLLAAACGGRTVSVGEQAPTVTTMNPDAAPMPDAPSKKDAGPPLPLSPPEPEDNSPTDPAQRQALPMITPGAAVNFTVPPGALGFHLLATFTGGPAAPEDMILDVTAPDGTVVHQAGIPSGGTAPTSSSLTGETASVQIPQSITPASEPVQAGVWTVTASHQASLELQVQRTPDGMFHGGALDLHVYLPSGIAVDAEGNVVNAQTAWSNRAMRDRLLAFFATAKAFFGLSRGTIEFIDIPSQYLALSENNLAAAFAETRRARSASGLHVVLSETSDGWWGVAPGIPGAVNTLGADSAAIALTLIPEATAEGEAQALTHELGHFIGLQHTTELEGDIADPLADTPRCTNLAPETLDRCPDFDNLMFPVGAGDNLTAISATQQRIMEGSPIYRTFLSGTPSRKLRLPTRLGYGAMFGHPNTKLSVTERWVLAHACPRVHALPTPSQRAELQAMRSKVPAAMGRIVDRILR